MSLLKISKDALRSVKKHTVGYSHVQSKILYATENSPARGTPFVSLSQRFEIAELSWDDAAFDQIADILLERLSDRKKWRRVVKALMILHYCVQEGSGRFGVWCHVNMDLIQGLQSYEYTFEENKDRGIEVRREARKLLAVLDHPRYVDMRTHAEGAHLTRTRTHKRSLNQKISLRRRGALFGFRRADRSDLTATSLASQESLLAVEPFINFAPVTVRQKVRNAVSSVVDLEVAIQEIRDIARRTTCPEDFMEIMEAILESLISEEHNHDWGQVLKALVLLRQCLSNVSEDVARHFEGNPKVMNLLRGFQDLGDLELIGGANAILQEKPPLSDDNGDDEDELHDALPELVPSKFDPMAPPAYAILNPDPDGEPTLSALDEKRRLVPSPALSSAPSSSSHRPLPQPPAAVDWSRLRTAAGDPALTFVASCPEKASFTSAWRASMLSAATSLSRRPLPPAPLPTTLSPEMPPHYSTPEQLSPLPPVYPALSYVEDDLEYEDDSDDEIPDTPLLAGLPDITRIADDYDNEDDFDADADSVVPSESWVLPWPMESAEEEEEDVALEREQPPSSGPLPPSIMPESEPSPSVPVANTTEEPPITSITSEALVSRPVPSTLQIPSASTSIDSSPPSARCLTGLVRRKTETACARGGYSDVFQGSFVDVDAGVEEEQVAVKVLRAVKMKAGCSPTERMKKRMNREMDIWGRLRHPGIVPLRGYAIEDDGTPALISPWFDHGDVIAYLEKHPFADRRKLVRQVASGLIYLHEQSPPVVHGDLKGGNVLIDRRGDAALCDFGLSKLLFGEGEEAGEKDEGGLVTVAMTTSNGGIGTLRWCAPELLNEDIPKKTLASDVWAFANLALEILTGRMPFHGCNNNMKIIHAIATGVVPSREEYPELPKDNRFWEVLEACWRRDPSARPTMEALRELIFDDDMFSALG